MPSIIHISCQKRPGIVDMTGSLHITIIDKLLAVKCYYIMKCGFLYTKNINLIYKGLR